MAVVYGLENVEPEMRGAAVALGVFDGVHWGHQTIFNDLTEIALGKGVSSVALTFDRHPSELLAPAYAPEYICTLDQRIDLILATGVQNVVVARFDPALANLTHEEFLRRVLGDTLGATHVVVGSNFLFGKGRKGDVRYLKIEGAKLGIGVSVVSSVIVDGGPVSSTRIRAMLREGDVVGASHLLGRKFTLRGKVVQGRQVGRELGFPTANLEVAPRQVVPARGVYAVEALLDGTVYPGLCSIGVRPTFGPGELSIEIHFMGFDGDLYGRMLDVSFVRRLRDEMKFETPEQLVEQIRRDLERVKGGS
jgi:riboflavin kinase/FMN adenylyltransferase